MVPAFDDGAIVDDEVLPPIDVLRQLVYAEVAHRGPRMARRDREDRAGWVMSGGPDVVRLGEIVDSLRFEQAA